QYVCAGIETLTETQGIGFLFLTPIGNRLYVVHIHACKQNSHTNTKNYKKRENDYEIETKCY
ncbi:MAG: hypothetical protein K2K74_17140, partial [Lachnospiraceae bacterium]|nr:hypothetical protein [Lachnospiraceae bacterium]